MSTIKTTNITHGSNSGTNNLILDDTGKVTVAEKKLHCPGTIIQVVSTIKTDAIAGTNIADEAWLTVSGLTATIAATTATKKKLITGYISLSASTGERVFYRLTAGGSVIDAATGDAAGDRARTTGGCQAFTAGITSIPINYLHTPGNTTSTSYGLDISHGAGGTTDVSVNMQRSSDDNYWDRVRSTSVLTLMEVVA